jgi:nicotinamide-nucleotide amidase
MAKGCQNLFDTDISLSTTGVAGPGKGEDGKMWEQFLYHQNKDQEVTSKLYMPHLERVDFMNFVSQKVIQDLVGLLVNIKPKDSFLIFF